MMLVLKIKCNGRKHNADRNCGCYWDQIDAAELRIHLTEVRGTQRKWLLWTCPNCGASTVVGQLDSDYKKLVPAVRSSEKIEEPKRD